MNDINQVRKALLWGVPFLSGVVIACWWMLFNSVIPATVELIDLAPAVRIGPLGYLMPLIGVIAGFTMLLLILRAIPYEGRAYKWLEYTNVALIFGSFMALVLILSSSALIQNHYMPKFGYARCDLLEGNPTLWFTDWVKNPDWCARGKSMEWVNEQARQSSSTQPAK